MKTNQTASFRALPKDYSALCSLFLPRPIHDKVGYENTVKMADAFAGFEDQMTEDQNDYFDLLCTLIAEYDKATVKTPKLRALALLKHLVAEQAMSGAGLSRILGKSSTLSPMILRGERAITAHHAVILGEHFGLPAGLFLK